MDLTYFRWWYLLLKLHSFWKLFDVNRDGVVREPAVEKGACRDSCPL